MAKHDLSGLDIKLVPSEGVVTEGEQPAVALRRKPRASIIVATGAQKIGKAAATVTMGSTGAAMAAAMGLGVMEGLERPALGGPIVGMAPNTAIIDLGTNVDCKPAQLLSFAVIGDVFARSFWGFENPRVALLSVGSEAGKGNRQVKETTELLERSGLNFVGNIEANDLPYSRCEVAVCDGFVGNVVMKLTEGMGSALADRLRTRLEGILDGTELESVIGEVYDLGNVVEAYGGGPLLGVDGVSVVGHGAARSESVARAIATANLAVRRNLVPVLNQELARLRVQVAEPAGDPR
jgi:glycerol-3-phosphate acyltransferase PlsX